MSDIGAEVLEKIFSRHNEIVAAYLFGSYAGGYAGPNSDIDIGLLLSDNQLGHGKYPVQIARELKEACKTKRNIDVRILNNGTLRFLHQVLKGRLLFCRDEKARIEFETSVISRYLDFKPIYYEYDRMRKLRILQ
ncbi:MAG: nucleotidyltransferase domain-containing protein [ANME-2 cluster archaeon]|nr:nucleotidyltransferase domain-containing protein [ANME-2 cluster archaeon]